MAPLTPQEQERRRRVAKDQRQRWMKRFEEQFVPLLPEDWMSIRMGSKAGDPILQRLSDRYGITKTRVLEIIRRARRRRRQGASA